MGNGWKMGGRAAHRHLGPRLLTDRVFFRVHLAVVAYIQIEIAVPIHITPTRTGAPMRIFQPGLSCNVHEAPFPVLSGLVVVEDQFPEVGHQEIRKTIVVAISDRCTHSKANFRKSRRLGHILECAIAPVPVQLAGQIRRPFPLDWG